MFGSIDLAETRPLRRAIQERIENPLAKHILEGKFGAKDRVKVGVNKGALSFSI